MTGSAKRFESILASFTDAVIILDGAGVIEWLNPSAEQTACVSRNHLIGSPISSVIPPGSAILSAIDKAIEDGVTYIDHDAVFTAPNGEKKPVGVTAHPMEDGQGAVVVLRDLSSLKALESFMSLNDKMTEMAVMAAGMAHEIKNPLAGIRGAAQLINREVDSDSLKELSQLIVSESDRINRLVVDLIGLNQPGDFPMEPVNIYPALDDCLKLVDGAIKKKRLTVKRHFDPSLPEVIGNQDKLRQVFLNIIRNAVDACQEGGVIRLATKLAWKKPHSITGENRRYVLIEISDDGAGLDESMSAHIFTPYFSGKKGGSGLGLSIAMRLARAHDGLLEIKNLDDKPGVVASVYLPYTV